MLGSGEAAPSAASASTAGLNRKGVKDALDFEHLLVVHAPGVRRSHVQHSALIGYAKQHLMNRPGIVGLPCEFNLMRRVLVDLKLGLVDQPISLELLDQFGGLLRHILVKRRLEGQPLAVHGHAKSRHARAVRGVDVDAVVAPLVGNVELAFADVLHV